MLTGILAVVSSVLLVEVSSSGSVPSVLLYMEQEIVLAPAMHTALCQGRKNCPELLPHAQSPALEGRELLFLPSFPAVPAFPHPYSSPLLRSERTALTCPGHGLCAEEGRTG